MTSITYHPSREVHAIAQVIALLIATIALCLVPILLMAAVPYICIALACIGKAVAVAALTASPILFIYLQKARR